MKDNNIKINRMFASDYFPFVNDIFNSEEELRGIFEKFQQFEDFRKTIPLRLCQVIKLKKDLDKFEIPSDGLKLILLTSIIELIRTFEPYIDFAKWYENRKKELGKMKCSTAWHKYNETYGSGHKFREFFDYLERHEKIILLTSIMILINDKLLPFCYEEKNEEICIEKEPIYLSECHYFNITNKCPLFENDIILNRGIRAFSRFLYVMRNQFVHMGRLPVFARDLSPYSPRGGGLLYNKRIFPHFQVSVVGDVYDMDGKTINVSIELSVDKLYRLLVKYLPSLINDYLIRFP